MARGVWQVRIAISTKTVKKSASESYCHISSETARGVQTFFMATDMCLISACLKEANSEASPSISQTLSGIPSTSLGDIKCILWGGILFGSAWVQQS